MFQTCPATGRMFHQFNKETHRCACGRWQAGFKPKKVTVHGTDECQVCEKHQAVTAHGELTHHGYRRPGWGYIVGDCRGVGHKPYPATNALKLWLHDLDTIEASLKMTLAELEGDTVESFSFEYVENRGSRHSRHTVRLQITRGTEEQYLGAPAYVTRPSFETMRKRAINSVKAELAGLPAEKKRVNDRIAKAKTITAK